MVNAGRLKVILFALPGFGNPVLNALLQDHRVQMEAVFTVKYDQPFPYYPERQLTDVCYEQGITCYAGVNVSSPVGLECLTKHAPDLILVATFKQILKAPVLQLPKLGVVNFHPSLLPRYRGPCPTNAVIANGETSTGVTVHFVTEQLDAGNVLLQRSIHIPDSFYDGQLRQKLAQLSGEMVPEVVALFADHRRPEGSPQDHQWATFAPKPTTEDGYLDWTDDINAISRKLRALNPIPGTSILIGDKRVWVDRFEVFGDSREHGLYADDNFIDLVRNNRAIRLFKKFRCEH